MKLESGDHVFAATVKLGGAAMIDRRDVAAALRKIANLLDTAEPGEDFKAIFDDNGNRVGQWKLARIA